MLDRTIEPAFHDAVSFDLKLKPCENYSLGNGVPVYSVNAGAEEVAQVEFVFAAGNWFEDSNLIAATTNYLLKNGTVHKTAYEIEEFVDFEGAYLSRACYNETATVTLHCLSRHLPLLLPLVAEILTESAFPAKELDIFRQNAKQKLSINLRKCDFVANRMIDQALYGFGHPYGTYTRAEDYDTISLEQIKAFYAQYYINGSCMIFTAGKLPANLPELLDKNFGHLPLKFSPDSWVRVAHPVQAGTDKVQFLENDPEGVQAAIRVARAFPNRRDPDFAKAQILNTIFGGYFGSRLMSNIREEKGYTYGIHSYLQNHIQTTAWVISTEVKKENAQDTLDEIWKEVNILRQELVNPDELALVKNYMIGSILNDLDGPFQIIGRWKSYILNGLDGEYFYNSIAAIKNITAGELRDIANKYLIEKDFYQITVI